MPEKIGRIIGLTFVLPIVVLIGLTKMLTPKSTKCECGSDKIHTHTSPSGITTVYCIDCSSVIQEFRYKI